MIRSGGTGEIALDIDDDVSTADVSHNGRFGDTRVDVVRLTELIEPNEEGGYAKKLEDDDYPDPPPGT